MLAQERAMGKKIRIQTKEERGKEFGWGFWLLVGNGDVSEAGIRVKS